MLTRFLYFVLIFTSEGKPQSKPRPVAVWADEIESWSPVNGEVVTPAPPAAVWADEIDFELSEPGSDKINDEHNSTPVIEKSPIDRIFQAGLDKDVESLSNKTETRQLEAIAFPVGIAIGAIGAAILPSLFPGSTTTTTTTQSPSDGSDAAASGDNFVIISGDNGVVSTTQSTTSTTEFVPRSVLEDFHNCGVKGSSNRVVGGTEVVENEYPWLCSLKYRGSHICGMTLLSGPPHDTILVGAAHCFSVGDNPSRYTITCGEHSLQKQDKYEVTLQVTEVIIHPRYVEASSSGFDIAVYKVNDAPLRGKMVEKRLWPACLPDINSDFLAETTYVAGWGITQTKFIHGTKIQVKGIPDIARHTYVTVTQCQDNDNFPYPNGLLCASDTGRDSCQGDSGGPLIGIAEKYSNRIDKRYSWIGIVSFGVGCAEPGYPGAYTRSSCYLGFVAQQFGLKADFTPPGSHSSWSTDCQNGASRRSSLVHRNTYNNKRKNSNKKKGQKKDKNRKDKTGSRSSNSTYIDRSKLITIDSLTKDEEEYTSEKNKKNKKKRNKDKHKSKSKMKKKHSRDNIDDEKVDDSDLVTLLNQLVEPLFS